MFVFEDVIKLDDFAIQRFIREVDTKDLAVALKAANEEVKQVILKNMSTRMRDTIEQDIKYLQNIRMRDVEEAQQKIVDIIRQLESAGEIVVARGGDDVLV
jgi:flagellar motor switch protein FliG